MRYPYRHRRFHRRRFRRSIRRGGRLLGLVGLTALGVTLLNKHQREQQRHSDNVYFDVEPRDYS